MAELKSAFKVNDAGIKTPIGEDTEEPPFKKLKLAPDVPVANEVQVPVATDATVTDAPNTKTGSKGKVKNVNIDKISTRNVPADRAPAFHGAEGTVLIDFQGTINRFRLVGPKSGEILRSVCMPADVESDESMKSEKKDLTWWKDYYSNPQNISRLKSQAESYLNSAPWKREYSALTVRLVQLLIFFTINPFFFNIGEIFNT